jgi:phage terminase large subunit
MAEAAAGALARLPAAAMDWRNPDYDLLFQERTERLLRLRANPEWLRDLRAYYRENPADFINDWGVTFDPRNADIDRPTLIPFILTPKQREWIAWVLERWRTRTPGINEKSRDMGVTWLAVSLSCTLCLFRSGVVIGFGSRKAEYVDEIGTHKPILPKARMFMRHLPAEFRGSWVEWRDAPLMRVNFPDTGSLISGEAGDEIGRGDRTSITFVDEAAHLKRPQLVDAALSQTTNCRIDISSVNGMNNPFAQKRWSGKYEVFIFDWRDDPRKDEEWYAKQQDDLDPVVVAQEIDRDYSASVHGIVIPGAWVRAAIDACEKLGVTPTGTSGVAYDVADEGTDANGLCGNMGVEINYLEEWSGKGGDIFSSTEHVFEVCDQLGLDGFFYDSDGLGAGVRGDARIINDRRASTKLRQLVAEPFRGSEAVLNPEAQVDPDAPRDSRDRKNKDYFLNRKAQGWWWLRRRFQKTYRWVIEGVPCAADDIISISSKVPIYQRLVAELCQPTYTINAVGKIVINKKPDGMKSPNLADAAMIKFGPTRNRFMVTQQMVTDVQKMGQLQRLRRLMR